MNVNVLLKQLVDKDSRDNVAIANRLGMKNAQALVSRLRPTTSPKIDFVARLLDELDYELVIVKKRSTLPPGAIVVESDFEFKPMPSKAIGAAARVRKQREEGEE